MSVRVYIQSVVCACSMAAIPAQADSGSLQDVLDPQNPLPKATIYTAKEIITMNPDQPKATAVAVVGDRILAVGSLDQLQQAAGDQPIKVDETFADKVIVPGFIAQHDHPLLSALTMTSHIISIEDWVLPGGTIPAAKSAAEYMERLKAVHSEMKQPDALLLTWGYHHYFHGDMSREMLDKVSDTRPIVVWHRSAHEFYLNTKALELIGLDEAFVSAMPEAAKKQADLKKGHFYEAGMFAILPKLMPVMVTPERFQQGLELTRDYFHANGVTLGCEPGGLFSKKLQDAQNAVFSRPETPFRYYFIPDGKSLYAMYPDTTITETEKILNWGQGMTSMVPKQIKLFADGAVYSQLMQVREPYLDGHHGEWIMPPKDFANAFRIYWNAGYQIHIHVTGDKGVDMVLDNLEANMRRFPRYDHRTVLVHFSLSQKDQIERIKRLGAIVSGNPYYVTMLADKYSEKGLGAERADNMVRMGDVERAGISYSYHSDMPMAPSQPLFLMDCAVNRKTVSGRVAGENQRNTREGALRAVTLEAAFSLGMEKEVGSIVSGKLANFTVLEDNPVTCAAEKIKSIPVWGTVHEGRVLPVPKAKDTKQAASGPSANEATLKVLQLHAEHDGCSHGGDICTLNHLIGKAMFPDE
ncbi:hypothetical protein SAMN02745181_1378 [Rubritalea squalenifaciens DSM 18772]|uniref:Amidohydrolase 3 domain-containing protein n=1 Tax=Rubritalea squalenifaciens DSM 18772 TaxID=1123071 RepID=A0A1M6H6H7_9BACT|nr:amidohydrolase [Rubritalea squalenifaciens]SHJ17837.1 hypothetical protein SAMN02745181_1378 [Rubritalea squalenifaciens DSM 18772]